MEKKVDIFIIGGGINGTAIAADAAGRGLSVALCEKGDLASGASSASTKLIHGGLRYLEFYEFNLVRAALKERETLMHRASNLIKPLEFVLPYEKNTRPAWLIRLGLFIYDHLAKRKLLPSSHQLRLQKNIYSKPLKNFFKKGFSYYDCFTDDSRLVILNAILAKQHHAEILPRHEFQSATYENNKWNIILKNLSDNTKISYQSTILINAAGPWVNQISEFISPSLPVDIKLDKGSHIIVPKLYEGNFAYLLQNQDKRVIFTIPYQNDFTLIGTTDVPYKEDLNSVAISNEEKKYLCHLTNYYFNKNISVEDIVWSYSGVRCLQAEAKRKFSQITRDYKLILNSSLLTVVGGKLTTHRVLAEKALDLLKQYFPHMKEAWTDKSYLPGCQFPNDDFEEFSRQFCEKFPWLPLHLVKRYTETYGIRAYELLDSCAQIADLGLSFSKNLFQREVEFLISKEWARTADDILWRRTKLGLTLSDNEKNALVKWMSSNSVMCFVKPA